MSFGDKYNRRNSGYSTTSNSENSNIYSDSESDSFYSSVSSTDSDKFNYKKKELKYNNFAIKVYLNSKFPIKVTHIILDYIKE